ncbi:Glyceraldehyde-3-phosphate dehydrogenase [Sporomusa silvacetica DSM 10669]|uniref:Glyceraldehyde-3-phosphate dehydrogenase n=1 Tax=Sporomusa silvacetica DSM 10669 TaxID=1123289 RepID=A0ABZ3IRP4_9FIRM|nr:glyceraldehyde 3-phosphate dehydrogenase NAD-binding domain-containing protein [Sporomusa silvacetica]OZC15355.1 glyceraldehyde-3-phosphate dehydrogenase [Sporomusa silvacetica DSM 10669]
MSIKVAINGFGRVGRLAFKHIFDMEGYEIVAINDLADSTMLSYLLKNDSTQGRYKLANEVTSGDNFISVSSKKINVYHETDALKLPWRQLDVDIVLECSGAYLSKGKSEAHLHAGAKKVVISAPAGADMPTIVFGINENLVRASDQIISAASCSTNCLALMAKALHDYAPIQSGISTTIHAFTATQMILDGPQRKGNLRRSRSAPVNIVPTTAEAAKAIGLVIPELEGKLCGSAQRVPVAAGSLILFIAVVTGQNITVESINAAMKACSSDSYGYTEEEFVSSDIIGITYGALFDATQTMVSKMEEDTYQVQVASWFDNESSYVSQMVKTANYFAKF